MTQVVNVVSWLRNISDEDARKGNLSDFKKRVLPLARQLDGSMAYEGPDRVRWGQFYSYP